MNYSFHSSMSLRTFFKENDQMFEQTLLSEAEKIKEEIRQILQNGSIDLIYNARQVMAYAIDNEKDKMKTFAWNEGKMWAEHTIDLSFKLEWIHALRRTVWIFVETYHTMLQSRELTDFFRWEREVNNCIDLFLNTFVESYTTYKEDLLREQKQLVETLSVPVIPINNTVSVLPLVGAMEENRLDFLKEKVLETIAERKIHTLVVDLSGIERMRGEAVTTFNYMIDGISLMGCETVITGIPSTLALETIKSSVNWQSNVKTLGTLQQALNEYL
ncbi:STAS domain-containing protein [Marinococcus luteus]|uniref:STAS domain-containing protein n=1 Tax=Marinococcus luteus TaxID=1122204 RepID=UPI002ACCE006|nr:STAS domain-containing protein [Marinococcus luteus]MDZ5782063.1 STAS domain-containing protein [Marinococcus luteus]